MANAMTHATEAAVIDVPEVSHHLSLLYLFEHIDFPT